MKKRIKIIETFFKLAFLIIFIIFISIFFGLNKLIQKNQDNLNLEKGNQSLIETSKIYLYDKYYQRNIIEKLYGNDLTVPDYYHLKDHIKIDTSDNQQNLAICGVFATLKAIETNVSITENQNYNFSERFIDYMTSKDFYGDRTVGNIKKDEGNPISYSEIFNFINDYGLALEEEVPYRNYDTSEYELIKKAKRIKEIKEYIQFSNPDEVHDKYYWMETIKKHITKYGGIIGDIHFYESLYNENKASFYNNGDTNYYKGVPEDQNTGHAIVIVGWDDNYSKDNFIAKPENNGAFIAYNSWSTNWGDNGYFYISYEDIDIFNYLIGIISTAPYYEKEKYFDEIEIPSYEDILYEEKIPDIQGKREIWYYAYILNKKDDYPQINEISLMTTYSSEISVYINPYNNNINDLKNFINVGNIEAYNDGYLKYRFVEPVNIYGDEFSVIIKYQPGNYKLYYHDVKESDNIYVYKNKKWEKTTKVPYFNIYGYKIWWKEIDVI